MSKVFFCDFDGTLVGVDKKISANTRRVIDRWLDAGNRFVIATGRLLSSIECYADELNVSEDIICCSGASVYHNKELVYEASVPSYLVEKLWNIMRQRNGYCQVYRDRELIAIKRDSVALSYERYQKELPQGYNIPIFYKKEFDEQLASNIHKLSFTFEQESEAKEVLGALGDLSDVNVFRSLENLYDIVHRDANKGISALWLQKRLGIEEAYAAGDNENDVAMLEAFKHSAVIRSAPPNVLKSAERIIGIPEEEGLADFIESIL